MPERRTKGEGGLTRCHTARTNAREPEKTMTQSAENDALREAAALGWDAAVAAMKYEDGTPVEVVTMRNPYRLPMTCGEQHPRHPDVTRCTNCKERLR